MPQYKKVFDAGLYSSGGGFTRVGVPTLRSPGSGGKQVAKSLRFRAANTAYLNRTFGTPTNQIKWTWSGWVKLGALGVDRTLFGAANAGSAPYASIFVTSGDNLRMNASLNGSTSDVDLITTSVYRDPSAWYHIVFIYDSAQGTSTNRCSLYVNGVQVTLFSTSTYPGPSVTTAINTNTYAAAFGRRQNGATWYFDGYLAETYFIDGQALTPSSFGEYNSDNIWVPKAYSGSYSGTNSFYLDFADTSSTAALGYDAAGSNDWTVNGISLTAGSTYDSMYDSPTDYDNSVYGAGNYATLNPVSNLSSSSTISNANLQVATVSSGDCSIPATIGMVSGKYYAEFIATTVNNAFFGIIPSNYASATAPGYNSNSVGLSNNGTLRNSGVSTASWSATWTTTNTMAIAFDADAGTVEFYKDNSKLGSTLTGFTTGPYFFAVGDDGSAVSSTWVVNFGQRQFAHTPPTGFKALNTKNITRPTDANMWFYGDTPDLVWIKNRSATSNHSLTDTVRGVGLGLSSNSTAAEQGSQDVAELNKFGMTLIGASSRTTASANNFVYWAWKGGGAASSNVNGTISSQVSANIAAGFSIVTYTGNGSTGATVGHGLNATPSMIITKARNAATDWGVWHTSLTQPSGTLWLQLNIAQTTYTNRFDSTGFTSSVFKFGTTIGEVNTNNNNYIAYCFAPIASYSAFGSYVGNNSADGPFVFTNMRPRFLMVKCSSALGSWVMFDSSRGPYNVNTPILFAHTTGIEDTAYPEMDFLSNGFKVRANDANSYLNVSGATYIYMAFAENPFKIARAR